MLQHGENSFTLIKTEHHSISDGWSGPLVMSRVNHYYEQLVKGQSVTVSEDRSYLDAQRYHASQASTVKDYWDKEKQAFDTINDLNPLLSHSTHLNQHRVVDQAAAETLIVENALYQSLQTTIRDLGITMNVVVQFMWHKLIQVYTQDDQTIVGTTISGRSLPIAGIEESIGCYINTCLLYTSPSPRD